MKSSLYAMKEGDLADSLAKFLKTDTYKKQIVDNCIDGSVFQCSKEEVDALLKESGFTIPGHRMRIRKWTQECKRSGSLVDQLEVTMPTPMRPKLGEEVVKYEFHEKGKQLSMQTLTSMQTSTSMHPLVEIDSLHKVQQWFKLYSIFTVNV